MNSTWQLSQGTVATGSIATKRTLAALSFAIERVALGVGPDSVLIALFQRDAYFASMAATYAKLADLGSTVVVFFAGDEATPPGVTRVLLDEGDPRADEWSVILLGPNVGAYLIGTDLAELDVDGRTLEARRRFESSWGFDRCGAVGHARRVLATSRDQMPVDVVARIDKAIAAAEELPHNAAESALGFAALSLASSLDDTSMRLDDARARLDQETQHATRDPLTGLTNREGLERWLGGTAMNGVSMPVTGVVMIDLDGFKAVNDTYGHDVGDQVLQAVAKALVDCTRPGDIVTRWGGDEFVVLCPGAEGEQLTQVARRMVAAVSDVAVGGARVGASAGIQTCRHRPLAMAAADKAMYLAKQAGGGRVVAIGPAAA